MISFYTTLINITKTLSGEIILKKGILKLIIILAITTTILIIASIFNIKKQSETLTEQEKNYLRQKDKIVFVSQTHYPPFEFLTPEGERSGMSIELARWMGTELGFNTKFIDTSFIHAQKMILSQEADVITSFFYSKERDKKFDFSQAIYHVPSSIFINNNRNNINAIEDLNNKRIAIQQGDYAFEYLKDNKINARTILTNNFNEATDLILNDSADAIIGDEPIVLYHIHSNSLGHKIKIVGKPLYIGENSMAVIEGNEILSSIIKKGIAKAKRSGVLRRIENKWLGTRIEKTSFKYFPHFIITIIAMFFIALFMWLWNLTLRTRVRKQTRALENSNKQYLALYNDNPSMYFMIDRDGLIISVNNFGAIHLGFTIEELTNTSIFNLLHPEDIKIAKENIKECFQNPGKVSQYELRKIQKDKSQLWVQEIIRAIQREDKKEVALIVNTDITARKNGEKKLRESESYNKILFENSQLPLFIMNAKTGQYKDCNKAAVKICGYNNKKELIGKTPTDLSPAKQKGGIDSGKLAKKYIEEATKKGSVLFEWILVRPSGVLWDSEVNLMTIEIKGEKLLQFSLTDITNRKKSEKEKTILQEQLNHSRKMDAIGQLAGGIAHDFNNMLAGIMGSAQLLKLPTRNLDEKSIRYVDMILRASTRAANLTAKLLAFGRKGKINSTPVNIDKIIKDTVDLLRQTIDKKIEIEIIKETLNNSVIGDNSALQNAFINLGINASHAMKNGGKLTFLTKNINLDNFYCEASPFQIEPGNYIEIEIRDTGTGINSKNLKKIFEPFFTTKEQGEGTGLGLAAVYGTVQAHHGSIIVYSEIGKGTVFHIYLPLSEEIVKNETITEKILTEASGQILLVDDEELIRITGKHVLEEMGFNVLIAENGEEAVKLFTKKKNEIDLVIMDMIMPKMNGSDAFYLMKKIDPECKIVISSGFTKDENLNELRKNGLAGFIPKPFSSIELSRLLRDVMEV